MKYLVDVEAKTKRGNIKYLDKLREIARNNRRNSTQAEFIMWQYLRRNKFGYKFTRQKPMFRFILDFYCSELLLVIEIDGGSHIKKRERDILRDKFLRCLNIETIRFENEEILNNLEKVKNNIIKTIKERKASLSREVLNEVKRRV